MGTFMRDTDAFSWYMERDPVLRSNVVAVAWLDRSPDWDDLCARVEAATRLVPSFRRRLIEIPGRIANPRWVAGPFELDWHLRRFDAPATRGPQTVLDFAARESTTAFDPVRPLWEFTLIEHLEGGRAALVFKVHHALTDGVGGMTLALYIFGIERNAPLAVDVPAAPHAESLDGPQLVRDGFAHDAGRLARGLWAGTRRAVAAVPAVALRPFAAAAGAHEMARSIGRTVAPVTHRLSPIMEGRSIGRRTDMVEVGVEDLKRGAAAADGTLNDGFMAAVTGGLRRYHERHGAPVESLRVTLPISIRKPGDPEGGNRITLMRFAVPVGEADPARRMTVIHERCLRARHERSLGVTDPIAGALSLLPAGAVGGILKRVDFVTSDVQGFAQPVYLGNAVVERLVSFSPTVGTAVNTTLLSYNGTCYVGINVDTLAVPDGDVLTECLIEGFEEVLALGGEHLPARRSLTTEDPNLEAGPAATQRDDSTPASGDRSREVAGSTPLRGEPLRSPG